MSDPLQNAIIGSAPGWPIVLYFHHVHPSIKHYTSLTPDDFKRAVDIALNLIGPALNPQYLSTEITSKEPTVLFTFDDGYRDNLDFALPILDSFGVKAMFFPIVNKITELQSSSHKPEENFMTWTEISDLLRAGHVIGAHTMTHPMLNTLSVKDANYEIKTSIQGISNRLNLNLVHFAYPYGLQPTETIFFPDNTLAFGTVKALARPWNENPSNIRRTYFPTGLNDSWENLAKGWRLQWQKLQ